MTFNSLGEIKKLINSEISDLKFPMKPKGLYEPVKYTLESGGKRLRPLLLLSFINALGANPKSYVNQALALEIYHNFTLLHDDVMDNADVRHGRPTVHKKWNLSTAILSGDLMLTQASILMGKGLSDIKSKEATAIFNETAVKIDEGQQYDMNFESEPEVTISEYEEMIMLKTGALFGCASGLAVILGIKDRDSEYDRLFKTAVKFGYILGIAFQLQDDYLDTFGDETFGKQIGGDIVNNKKTWLLINLLNSKYAKEARILIADKSISDKEKIERTTTLYNKLGLKEKLLDEINKHYLEMGNMLDEMSAHFVEGGKEQLHEYISNLTGRRQ